MIYRHQPLGTIIASVLEYDKFCQAINDTHNINNERSTYVPCDGRRINGSKLEEMGVTEAPDLRGRFLRGLNLMYNHGDFPPLDLATADPGGNARRAGSYQSDRVGRHTHALPTNDDGTGHSNNYKVTGYPKQNGPVVQTWENDNDQGETRPRNVAVYYYIKIN